MFLEDCYKFFIYNSVDVDETSSSLEELTIMITNDFFSQQLDICAAFTALKQKIKVKYPKLFPQKIRLSLLHKTDNWNITDKNSKYIVAGHFYPENKCHIRYLLLVSGNNIKIVDKMVVNIDVNSKNIFTINY